MTLVLILAPVIAALWILLVALWILLVLLVAQARSGATLPGRPESRPDPLHTPPAWWTDAALE